MAEQPSGQCEYCGHIRYTNDLFNGECVPCAEWAQGQIDALRAEVAEQRMCAEGYGKEVLPLRAEVERLTAELARYTGPLTEDQMRAASAQWETMIDDGTDYGNVRDWDAAIRAAREGESK